MNYSREYRYVITRYSQPSVLESVILTYPSSNKIRHSFRGLANISVNLGKASTPWQSIQFTSPFSAESLWYLDKGCAPQFMTYFTEKNHNSWGRGEARGRLLLGNIVGCCIPRPIDLYRCIDYIPCRKDFSPTFVLIKLCIASVQLNAIEKEGGFSMVVYHIVHNRGLLN